MKNLKGGEKNLIKEIKASRRVPDKALFKGSGLCLQNSEDLIVLAKIAYKKGMYPHAASLATLAMEELSKASTMQTLILETDPVAWWSFWKLFSGGGSHKIKLKLFSSYLYWAEDDLDKMIARYKKHKEFAERTNALKKQGFYVDYNKSKNVFIKPSISKKKSAILINHAEEELARSSSVQKLGFSGLIRVKKIALEIRPPQMDKIIFDKVGKFRENQERNN